MLEHSGSGMAGSVTLLSSSESIIFTRSVDLLSPIVLFDLSKASLAPRNIQLRSSLFERKRPVASCHDSKSVLYSAVLPFTHRNP